MRSVTPAGLEGLAKAALSEGHASFAYADEEPSAALGLPEQADGFGVTHLQDATRRPGDGRVRKEPGRCAPGTRTWVQSFHGLLSAIDAYVEVEATLRVTVEAVREAGYAWDILEHRPFSGPPDTDGSAGNHLSGDAALRRRRRPALGRLAGCDLPSYPVCGRAQTDAPCQSTATTVSSPTTQASWPGGNEASSPAPNSNSVPSSIWTCTRPEIWYC